MSDVIKIGGNDLDDVQFVEGLVQAIKALARPVILVHGGGKEISAMQTRLGLQPRYVEGLRVTDDEALAVTQMILSGLVNKRLVAALLAAGVDALGLSGVDRAVVQAEKMEHPTGDLGWVGRIVSVRAEVLMELLKAGVTPVLAPLCWGSGGYIYNVNADHVAEAVARAVAAEALVFVSNVPGVLVGGRPVAYLSPEQVNAWIADGTISGGMIPKVRSALTALERGVAAVRITDLQGLLQGTGTVISDARCKSG